MKILSLMIAKNANDRNFKYHWKTKQIGLTHLSFADDLILFCHGDLDSIRIMKRCLDSYASVSGLQVNPNKSMCYISNSVEFQPEDLVNAIGFQIGSLPATFLGLPIITSRLRIIDCYPLLLRLKNRVSSWTSRFLSFAGRLQLIKAILFSIQSYWARHFFLPATVLKAVNSLLSRFLWKGNCEDRHGAKIAWSRITLPFSEGGLNLKCPSDWNTAHILHKLLIVINTDAESIWAKWVRIFNIRGNFWAMKIPADCTWCWRKILKLREIARNFISFSIGDGASTSLWFDPWLGNPLANNPNSLLILNSGLGADATVQNIIFNSNWALPSSNHAAVIEFRNGFNLSTPFNPDVRDKLLWDNVPIGSINVNYIWKSIRKRGLFIAWHNIAWFKAIPPRVSFHMWLAFHHRIRTADKIIGFGIPIDATCGLCGIHPESFDHLYFNCPFSFRILYHVLHFFCGWRGMSRNWVSITNFILSDYCKGLKAKIIKLGFAIVCYFIWKERNYRIHEHSRTPVRMVVKNCILTIKCTLASLNWFKKSSHRSSFRHWNL